jgi:hypothetical protein
LLVWPGGLMMVDFETGHFGDPAFDLGLFLAHLMLKTIHRWQQRERYIALTTAFWQSYEAIVAPHIGQPEYDALVSRGLEHLAGCAWARLDGKSRVEYLDDPAAREKVRRICLGILESESPSDENPLKDAIEC